MLFYIFEDSTQDQCSRREIPKSKNHLAVKYIIMHVVYTEACIYAKTHYLLINETLQR